MGRLSLTITDGPGGAMIADHTGRARQLRWSSDLAGDRDLSYEIDLPLREALRLVDRTRPGHVRVSDGAQTIWAGRLTDPGLASGQGTTVRIQALGYRDALADIRHTALWSSTDLQQWRKLDVTDRGARQPDRYVWDSGGEQRLFIGLKKNQAYTNSIFGSLGFEIPDGSSRDIVGVQFELEYDLPATYAVQLARFDGGFGGAGTSVSVTVSAGPGVTRRGIYAGWSGNPCDAIAIELYYNAAGPVTYTGEDGASYVAISKLRVVTSNAGAITGTLGTTIAAGTRVVTPSDGTSKIYVGQYLHIDAGGGALVEEIVQVTAVTSTTFTATFARAHNSTALLRGYRVTPDEIAGALLSEVRAVNGAQLAANTEQIGAPGGDLTDYAYADATAAEVVADLAARGDGAQAWEWGVGPGRILYLRPPTVATGAWQLEVDGIELERSLSQLANAAYATYAEPGGRERRTALASDAASLAAYGIRRDAVVASRSTSQAAAEALRAVALADGATPRPRGALTVRRVLRAGGAVPAWLVRAGARCEIPALPVTGSASLERLRSFRIVEVRYDADSDRLEVTPETPVPRLEYLINQQKG